MILLHYFHSELISQNASLLETQQEFQSNLQQVHDEFRDRFGDVSENFSTKYVSSSYILMKFMFSSHF